VCDYGRFFYSFSQASSFPDADTKEGKA